MSAIVRKIIATAKAPAAVGPYSQAVQAGNTLYISGQLGLDPKTMTLVAGGVVPETKQALMNMRSILEAAGASFKDVVKCTVLVTDLNEYAAVNDVYNECFKESLPARLCYEVPALPKGGKVEIDAIAVVGER